jgi:hypothetical protein
MVQTFSANGSNQPLYERMRQRHVGDRFDLCHFQNSQVGLPLMEPIQRIMVRAQVFRQGLPSHRLPEHPAQSSAIDNAAVNSKANNTPRELVHHDQDPMGSQRGRLATEQIATPQAVLHMAKKRQPGRTRCMRIRFVMNTQNAPNHVFVDLYSKSQRDLLGDSKTTPTRIPPFHFDDSFDQFPTRPFRTRALFLLGRKQEPVLLFEQQAMEVQQRRGLQYHGGTQNPSRSDEEATQTGDSAIRGTQIGSTFSASVENQQLVSQQNGFGKDRTNPPRATKTNQGADQMDE